MRMVTRMSSLVKKVAQLETARAEQAEINATVARLERELALDLHIDQASQRSTPRFPGGMSPVAGPRKRAVVTPEMIAEMKRRAGEGEPHVTIAASMGLHDSTVYRHVHDMKQVWKKRRRESKYTPEIIAAIKAGPKEGETARDHMKRLGVTHSAYYKFRSKS